MSWRICSPVTTGLLALAAVLLPAIGCAPGSKLKTVPVSGKVTLNGSPLADATVAFVQEAKADTTTKTYTATGRTDAQGVYKLSSFETPSKPVTGAVPGQYTVIITKSANTSSLEDMMKGSTPAEAQERMKGKSFADMGSQGKGVPLPTQTGDSEAVNALQQKGDIPAKYGNPMESGLKADVKDSGAQTFDFPLEG